MVPAEIRPSVGDNANGASPVLSSRCRDPPSTIGIAVHVLKKLLTPLGIVLGIAGMLFGWLGPPGSAKSTATPVSAAPAVPAPVLDEPGAAAGSPTRTVVLAGGCFWGVQGVFEHVKGVTAAVSGYAGGTEETANYETVGTGETGHAESVRISYDPSQITLGKLLRVFFTEHDPTQVDRQDPDSGTQYRSAIFAQDDSQKRIAGSYIAQLNAAKIFKAPIATRVEYLDGKPAPFFPAEEHHQDYLNSTPDSPYIAINDIPKVNGLKQVYPDLYREQPVLVLASNR
jgi:peptide-methionine (S)-S-oxide reductase